MEGQCKLWTILLSAFPLLLFGTTIKFPIATNTIALPVEPSNKIVSSDYVNAAYNTVLETVSDTITTTSTVDLSHAAVTNITLATVDRTNTILPTTSSDLLLDISMSLLTLTTVTVSDMPFSVSVTSSLWTTPPSPTTTTARSVATTPPNPLAHVKCQSVLAPHIPDASFQILVPDVLIYTCNSGFAQVLGSARIYCITGGGGGWAGWGKPHQDFLKCEPIRLKKPDAASSVPGWLVPMIMVAAVLLALLVFSMLLLFLYLRRSPAAGSVYPWQQDGQMPSTEEFPLARETQPAKEQAHARRSWPWNRSTRPEKPPGYGGPDGVASFLSNDNGVFPVAQRYS